MNRLIEEMRDKYIMDLYSAGNTRGNSDYLLPEIMIKDYNILLSYMHSEGEYSTDKVGEVKKGG